MAITKQISITLRSAVVGIGALLLTALLFIALASISSVKTGVEAALNAKEQFAATAEVRRENESLEQQLAREQANHENYKAIAYRLVSELKTTVERQRRTIGYDAALLRSTRKESATLKSQLNRLQGIRTYQELLDTYSDSVPDMPAAPVQ